MNLEILLSAIQAKDKNAFNILYDETINQVYSLAFKFTRSEDLAEEVVGDVYLQVWRQADQYDSTKCRAMGWVLLICRSRALDLLRKQKRIHDKTEEYVENSDAHSMTQIDILEVLDDQTVIHKALSQLDSQQQQLISLAYFKGYTHNELTNVTGLPLGTVKSSLRRSLIQMQEHIQAGQA